MLFLAAIYCFLYVPFFKQNSELFLSSFIVAVFMVPITFFTTKYILEAPRRKRWKRIKKTVQHSLNEHLRGIFTELTTFCGFSTVLTSDKALTRDELLKKVDENLLQALRNGVKNRDVAISKHYKKHILEQKFTTLFDDRSKDLSEFENKYLEYLDADSTIAIIKLQKALYRIDEDIRIRNNKIYHKWDFDADDNYISRINKHFQTIADNLLTLHEKGIFIFPKE